MSIFTIKRVGATPKLLGVIEVARGVHLVILVVVFSPEVVGVNRQGEVQEVAPDDIIVTPGSFTLIKGDKVPIGRGREVLETASTHPSANGNLIINICYIFCVALFKAYYIRFIY